MTMASHPAPQVPLEKTPLPGAMMPLALEKKMVPPESTKKPHHKPDMVDHGDKDQTIPV